MHPHKKMLLMFKAENYYKGNIISLRITSHENIASMFSKNCILKIHVCLLNILGL